MPRPGDARRDLVVVASFEPLPIFLHRRAHPDDRARPVVALDADDRVEHADPLAKQCGIEPGMRLAGAQQRSDELVVAASGGPDQAAAWAVLEEEAYAFSPRVCTVREGVLAFEGEADEARAFARAFGVRVGAAASVEAAHLLAYTAARGEARASRDPWTVLDDAPAYLLRGVGLSRLNLERLGWLGVERIGELRAWSAAQLTAYLAADGAEVVRHLKGPHRSRLPIYAPLPTLRATHAFYDTVLEPHQVDPVLERLALELAERLGDRAARHVTVETDGSGLRSRATRRAKRPLRDPWKLLRAIEHALEDAGSQALGIDEVAVTLSGLSRPSSQGSLWQQRERLERAVRDVHERYAGQARRFVEIDPHALLRSRHWALVDAATGEPIGEAPLELPAEATVEALAGGAALPPEPAPGVIVHA